MNVKGRTPNYSEHQFLEVWHLWGDGHKLGDVAQMLNINPGSIHGILNKYGGIAPYRCKHRDGHLTMQEREKISRGLAAKQSFTAIARELHRPTSTVSREVQRNGGRDAYRAVAAQGRAKHQRKRPKRCRLDINDKLRDHVISKLLMDWSPEQIAGELPLMYPDDETMRISHETIYRTLYIQARGALKKELCAHLRRKRKYRRPCGGAQVSIQGQIKDAVSIRERPAEVEDRAVPGHWEGDLLLGTIDSQVATLVERTSRFLILIRTESKQAEAVSEVLAQCVTTLPEQLKKSLTWDRGSELADHKRITVETGVKIYFCDPRSPWQRGSNENTNGLLRQYLPKGTDLSRFTQKELDEIALRLNTRPRKTLGFRTPAVELEEILHGGVASTD